MHNFMLLCLLKIDIYYYYFFLILVLLRRTSFSGHLLSPIFHSMSTCYNYRFMPLQPLARSFSIKNVKKFQDSEIARLTAILKKTEAKTSSLERSIDQKIKENEELTAICDELIAKVGNSWVAPKSHLTFNLLRNKFQPKFELWKVSA